MFQNDDDIPTPQVDSPQRVQTATAAHPEQVNPSALTIEQVSHLLSATGAKRADVETIRRHIASGAPVSAEGKVNLMHYMAWLMREVSHGEE